MVERASLHCQRNDAFFMKQVHQSSQGSPITSPWTLLRGAISEVAPRVFKRDLFLVMFFFFNHPLKSATSRFFAPYATRSMRFEALSRPNENGATRK